MDHFQKLPDEMLLKVFSFLGARSLGKCRRVSKRFKLWVENLTLKELAIKVYHGDYNECCSWYHTGGSVDRSDFICLHMYQNDPEHELDRIKTSLDPELELSFLELACDPDPKLFDLFQRLPLNLSRLQRVKIAIPAAFIDKKGKNNAQKLVQLLNGFVELEHLEMNVPLNLGKEAVLRLPNLRILLINSVLKYGLVIDAPQLNVLSCRRGLNRIKVSTPETVKQIDLQYDMSNLEGYRSVEIFRCKCPLQLKISTIDQILEFCPKLRQLHIEKPYHQGYVQYAAIKELMHHLLAQKDLLKRENLDAYLFGIKLSDEEFEQQVPADDPVFARSDESDDDYFYHQDCHCQYSSDGYSS